MRENTIGAKERVRIHDFLQDYAHAIDDGELEHWPNFFAPDGTYKIITRENYEAGLPLGILYCEGRGMMSDRIVAMREANIFEPHAYCHLLSQPRLQTGANDDIKARSNFLVIRVMQNGDTETFATGKYLDTIAMRNGLPLIKERIVVLESRRIDILLVYPL